MTPKEVSAQLRELADTVDRIPDTYFLGASAYVNTPASTVAEMVDLAKIVGGKWDKSSDDSDWGSVRLARKVSSAMSISVYMPHSQVCKKVVTTEVVPARPEMVIPATPETTKEVVTWECPESLLEVANAKVP